MIRKNNVNRFNTFMIAAAVMLGVVMSSSAFAKTTLVKMRMGQGEDKTRVVFEIKQNHRFEITTLKNPARIVVDFYKAKNDLTFSKMKFLDARVKQARVKNQSKRTRVVLDLRDDFDYDYFTLAKNKSGAERVVIDVSNRKAVTKIAKKSVKPVKKVVKKTVIAKKAPNKKEAAKQLTRKIAEVTTPKENKTSRKEDVADNHATRSMLNNGSDVFRVRNKELVVAIDAGHGGKDTGAIGHDNLREKVVVLKLAKKLKKYIDAQPGMRAVLTRDRDVFIPLHKRVRIAHKKEADIFLSLHADAFPDARARGGSVYILSTNGASSVMARILAKSENASLQDVKLKGRDADVAFVLSDLTRSANIRASRKLGQSVLGEMARSVRLHKKSVQSADFAVLKSIDMPSLLIETAFISNPVEARKLSSDRFQAQMAKSIVSGLDKFVKHNATKPRWGEQLYVHYRVQSGDTLSEIAENYNISTYKLKKINGIRKADRLYVGKKLRIPVSEDVIATL
ncbi:N-acetylmuramoyl-L-alanine amidase [Hydrogenovibrio sp. 3SP14C1]|uniref:N-acetylmuramoyl-L-alanine amidase n=1 Tax=Hydrogenovibrio sp. 3SP14C1 TaxID=3038774 RepID=UPI002418038C|nr:N-acetylmuramoyl-L-alanine amidase [Hydrogenovibrio sp. 3SP14C1]MDG4812549.1 N-acetylmuramoyl-L-alanine amidase [Hydrogenovibrio sp. 3SP14C1]